MQKKNLRQQQIKKLQSLSQTKRAQETAALHQRLWQSASYQKARSIALTMSTGIELDTAPLIEQAWADHKQVYLPRTVSKTHQMHFLAYHPDDVLVRSSFGLLEPSPQVKDENNQVDLLLVPGLAFSRQEHQRVGFGGGYYDRFLANYQGHSLVLALSPMVFAQATWPVSDYDQAFETLLTIESEEQHVLST